MLTPTAKQTDFFAALQSRHERRHGAAFDASGFDLDDRRGVSRAIDAIKASLERMSAAQGMAEDTAPGFYVDADGTLIRAKRARATGCMYGLVLADDGGWEYTRGVLRRTGLRAALLDEIAGRGRAAGVCLLCGRTLTDPDSRQRGVGPVCARRYTADEREAAAASRSRYADHCRAAREAAEDDYRAAVA